MFRIDGGQFVESRLGCVVRKVVNPGIAIKRDIHNKSTPPSDEKRCCVVGCYMMAPQPDIDDVGQLNQSLPKGLDDHFLVQIGGIIDQDVQMSAFLTDSLKEGTGQETLPPPSVVRVLVESAQDAAASSLGSRNAAAAFRCARVGGKVTLVAFADQLLGSIDSMPSFDIRYLVLQFLVNPEEMLDLATHVCRNVINGKDFVLARIMHRDREYFVIVFLAIEHVEHAERPDIEEATGKTR